MFVNEPNMTCETIACSCIIDFKVCRYIYAWEMRSAWDSYVSVDYHLQTGSCRG